MKKTDINNLEKALRQSVIIPISEYEELKKIKKEFIDNFDKNKIYIHSRSFFCGPSGYPSYEHYIINPTELVCWLNKELKERIDEGTRLYNESYELKKRLEYLNWLQRLFI